MTMSEKLLGGLFFFLMAPALVILAPTISLAVIVFVALVFALRSLLTETRRCLSCGHVFRLSLFQLFKSQVGQLDCPSCKKPAKQAKFERITR